MGRSRFVPVFCLLAVLLNGAQVLAQSPPPSALVWQSWSDDVFAQAKREHKFVLLDLEAVWCHWCHVMDRVTYQDAAVRSLPQAKACLGLSKGLALSGPG